MRLLFALLGLAAAVCGQDFDVLIRGGRIVDGAGNPAWTGDIGIRGGRIAAMGRLAGKTAERTIDAAGLTVAPGFIDIHNHSDYTIVRDGNAESMVRQGVTTMILGEGGSAAPVGGKQERRCGTAGLEGLRRLLRAPAAARHRDEHRHLRGVEPDLDLRARGEGRAAYSSRSRCRCARWCGRPCGKGALGVASSLSGPPGSWIDTDTLVAMCEAAGEYGGSYSTHMRTEGNGVFESVAEALEIGRRAHVPVDIIHLKIAEHRLWGKMPELVASHRRGARPRRGCAGQRLPVSRGAEQSLHHHSAVGARGRPAGAHRPPEGPRAAPAARKRNPQRHPGQQLVQPLHRHRRLGRHAAGVVPQPEVQAVRGQAHERGDPGARQAAARRAVRAADRQRRLGARRSTSITPRRTCATP